MNIRRKRKLFSGATAALLFLGILLLLTGCGPKAPTPRYVFLFIGDGMGPAQVHAAEIFLEAAETGEIGSRNLEMSTLPAQGYMTTHSYDSAITDSAAAATAMFTGTKTRNGRINVDEAGENKLKIITEAVKKTGRKIGVISNVSLDHATPAACYAHVPHRTLYYEIALEMAQSPVDFFGGGGLLRPTGRKKDQPDAVHEAEKAGYTLINTRKAFSAFEAGDGKILAVNETLTSEKAMPYEIDREKDDLPLAAYVKKAAELLDNPNGFFLMVEGGKIDWACHDHDAATAVREVLALNDAVKEALAFAGLHPDKTLIVVTADHETGGLALCSSRAPSEISIAVLSRQRMSLDRYSDEILNPYLSSTKEEARSLDDLLDSLGEFFDLRILTTDRKLVLNNQIREGSRDARIDLDLSLTPLEISELQTALRDTKRNAFRNALAQVLSAKAGLTWATGGHSALPLPVFAKGIGQEMFNAYFDNTDLAKKLAVLMGVSLESQEKAKFSSN